MAWFTTGFAFDGWSIPFLGLLPYLGDHAAALRLEDMTLSIFMLLPRLTPGPQLFLGFLDPAKLPTPTTVFGQTDSSYILPHKRVATYDGFKLPGVRCLGSPITSEEALTPYSITVWDVLTVRNRQAWLSQKRLRFCHFGGNAYSLTMNEALALASFLMTISVFAIAVFQKDGAAIVGVAILSFYTTVTNYYCIRILDRQFKLDFLRKVWSHRTQVVVRTETNAIWIIRCDMLAFANLVVSSRLQRDWEFDGLTLSETTFVLGHLLPESLRFIGHACLALAYILLANSKFMTQVAIALAYIVITFIFYIAPPGDMSNAERFTFERVYPAGLGEVHLGRQDPRPSEREPTLARTLWYAIQNTKRVDWFDHILGPQPEHLQARWGAWLDEALKNANNPVWPAEGEKRRLVDLEDNVYEEVLEEPADQRRDPSLELHPVPVSEW